MISFLHLHNHFHLWTSKIWHITLYYIWKQYNLTVSHHYTCSEQRHWAHTAAFLTMMDILCHFFIYFCSFVSLVEAWHCHLVIWTLVLSHLGFVIWLCFHQSFGHYEHISVIFGLAFLTQWCRQSIPVTPQHFCTLECKKIFSKSWEIKFPFQKISVTMQTCPNTNLLKGAWDE